jgi:hypothetical protein
MNQNKKAELPKIIHRQLAHLPVTDKIRRFPSFSHGGFRFFGGKIIFTSKVCAE